MSRILVTGSRYASGCKHANRIANVLFEIWDRDFNFDRDVVLVHGAARGADSLADAAWRSFGGEMFHLPIESHPADWTGLGKAAGFIRNQKMVDLGADVCIAFPLFGAENRGTAHCANRARRAGIHTITFDLT